MSTLVIWAVSLGALISGVVVGLLQFRRWALKLDRETARWTIRQCTSASIGFLVAAIGLSLVAASAVHQRSMVIGTVENDGRDHAPGIVVAIVVCAFAAGAWFMVGFAASEARWLRADLERRHIPTNGLDA